MSSRRRVIWAGLSVVLAGCAILLLIWLFQDDLPEAKLGGVSLRIRRESHGVIDTSTLVWEAHDNGRLIDGPGFLTLAVSWPGHLEGAVYPQEKVLAIHVLGKTRY